MNAADELAHAVKNRYGNKVDVSIIDPRHILSFWYYLRYKVSRSLPAFVLDRKKIFDGVPELADLERAIDEKLAWKS